MSMKKENRVLEVLDSLEGIERARAPEDGFTKIQQKIAKQRPGDIIGESSTKSNDWLKVAATVTLLICFNAAVVTNYLYPEDSVTNEISDYTQLLTDFDLYSGE